MLARVGRLLPYNCQIAIIPTTPPDQHFRFQVLTRLADPGMVYLGMIGAKRFTGPSCRQTSYVNDLLSYQHACGQWGG